MAEPRKVLIVDDEPDLLLIYAKRLESWGYKVKTAGGGLDGVREAIAWRPDAIVLDIMMPEPDGWDSCRILQLLPSTRRIPVVMCSAKHERADVIKSLSVGAKDYIVKPFDARTFRAKLSKALGEDLLPEPTALGAPAASSPAEPASAPVPAPAPPRAPALKEPVSPEEAEEAYLEQHVDLLMDQIAELDDPEVQAGQREQQGFVKRKTAFVMETGLEGDVFVIQLKGSIGDEESKRIEDAIRESVAMQVKKVLLDLTGVTTAVWEFNKFMDDVYRDVVRDGARLRVVAKNAYVRQILGKRQFRGRTHATLIEALRAFKAS